MGVFYEFDEVDAFTVGAVGQPGQRVSCCRPGAAALE